MVGTFGFLLPHKGTLELVKALDPLRADFPDLLLIAACARYPHVESKEYEEEIRAEISARGMEDSVLLITEYLPDEMARTLLRASDVIVLPYQETGESSSAALRFILPLGRPVVVTDSPIFNDSRDALLVVRGDPAGLEAGVRRVLLDPDLQRDLARRSARRRPSVPVAPGGRRPPGDLHHGPAGRPGPADGVGAVARLAHVVGSAGRTGRLVGEGRCR